MNEIVHMGLTEARMKLSHMIKRVYTERKTVVLEKGGLAVAVVINIEEWKEFQAYQQSKHKRTN